MEMVCLKSMQMRFSRDKEVWKEESDRRHIGIKSIQQRIRYLYGNEYGISIVTGYGEGTTVKLILPVRKGDIDNV